METHAEHRGPTERGIRRYWLGAPMFANPAWRGRLFTRNAQPADFLAQYGSVLNAVEGNGTFYGLPSEATVTKWRETVPSDFRFFFKFPRAISHESTLAGDHVQPLLTTFFRRLSPLIDQTGALLLQLPPTFGADRLGDLAQFVAKLPREWHYAVEPRHPDFFGGPVEQRLLDLLTGLGMNRAIFDTVDLQALATEDPTITEAQRKKPKMPRRADVTGARPFVRYVGHNHAEHNLPSLRWLVERVVEWIDEGREPAVFMHAPDDTLAPALCRVFHQLIEKRLGSERVGCMPSWPGEVEPRPMRQLELF